MVSTVLRRFFLIFGFASLYPKPVGILKKAYCTGSTLFSKLISYNYPGYRYHVHAVDSSNLGIQKLEKYAYSQGLDNIDSEVADARTLQLASNCYDLIVVVTLLDHLTREEGKKVTESIIDALKPGGFVFIEAYTAHDPAANAARKENEAISETASFVQHYFDDGE